MCLYTLYILVICLSVQSSLGNDVGDAENRILLKPQHHEPEPSNGTIFPTPVKNNKVCDKAVTLQKILGVMLTMLRQDLSENSKTAFILETLKDLLRNTAGYNDEVMYKIDDLLRTLDKYKNIDVSKDKALRAGLDNLNSFMKILVRKPTKLNQNIQLSYELPALTNSYCTEALLNIIKIAYQTYGSLAKNPICSLPTLTDFPPGIEIPDINSRLKHILELTYNLKPQPGVGESIDPKSKFSPFLVPELQSDKSPSNKSPINLFPNVDIFNPHSEKPTIQYKPVYEYHPTVNDDPIYHSEWSPQIPNDLVPEERDLNYPKPYNARPSYPTGGVDNKNNLNPYFPQNADVLPFDFSPPSLENPVHPYNSILERYPELHPQNPISLPIKTDPDFPFDVRPHSTPLNPFYPDPNNPLTIDEPVPIPWGNIPSDLFKNPQLLNPYVKENPEEMFFDIPSDNKPGTPVENEIYPASTKYLHLDNPKYFYQRPLLSKPETETFKHKPLVQYSPDAVLPAEGLVNPLAESEVFEFPYQADTPKPNDVFAVNSLLKYPVNPIAFDLVTNNDSPTTEVYEFNLKPNELKIESPLSVSYPFMSNNLVQEFKLKPNELNHNNVQNPAFEFELNPNEALVQPSLPNPSPYDWISKPSSATMPQDYNPFFPKPIPRPNTLQVPELEVIEFIRDAVSFIEKMIPVIKFDPPTLYIIAKIKNILVKDEKDLEVDEYATILELYKHIINYVKQLSVYKQIIDLIDLPPVTNRSKLKTKKVVELTYLVKRPQPVVYYPYYYVKYRLPYPSFVVAAQNLLKEKTKLRTNPKKLYEKLLDLSKVAETSPDLKTYNKKDLLGLTFKTGSLVDAKLVGDNDTLTEQLNVLRDITSDLTAEEILELNKEATNKLHLLATNSKTINDQKNYNDDKLSHLSENKLKTTEKMDKKQDAKQLISPLIPDVPLRTNFLANNYQTSTEPSLKFISFNSDKLRNDILRGEHVGLPFSDQTLPTNVNQLSSQNEPNLKNQGLIAPALYKLVDATLDASNVRDVNQQNFMNSGGLANLDNEIISLNTGKSNHQASINISNPKIMINSAATVQNLLNLDKSTSLDNFSQQASISKQNMWANQQNYHNSGGLVNFDNQKISLNEGTGNSQEGVNFINPKVMFNKATDSVLEHTRTPPVQSNSINLNPNSDETTGDTTHEGSNTAYGNPTESSKSATTPDDLFNFGIKGVGIPSQIGNMNVGSPKTIIEQTGSQSLLDVGVNQQSPYSLSPNKEEMSNIIKKTVSKDVRQFENEEEITKLPGKGENNNQGYFDNYHNSWNIGTNRPSNNDQPILDINNFPITTGQADVQRFNDKNNMAANGAANINVMKFNDPNVVLSPGSDNAKKSVSSNNNQWFPYSEIGSRGIGYNFHAGMAGQQGIEGGRPLNIATPGFEGEPALYNQQNFAKYGIRPGFSGQQTITSQQNFANFGINPGFSRGYMVQSMPIVYKRPLIERLPLMTSTNPFIARFTRPGLFYG